MKKFIPILFASFALLMCFTSCEKDPVGDHSFFTNTIMNVRDGDRAMRIKESITSDVYFTTKHTYKGKFSKAVEMAADEFDEHVHSIDDKFIESQLQFGESVNISLWSMNPGQRWLTYVITPDYMMLDEDNL